MEFKISNVVQVFNSFHFKDKSPRPTLNFVIVIFLFAMFSIEKELFFK